MRRLTFLTLLASSISVGCSGAPLASEVPTTPTAPPPGNPGPVSLGPMTGPLFQAPTATILEDTPWYTNIAVSNCIGSPGITVGTSDNPAFSLIYAAGTTQPNLVALGARFLADSSGTATVPITIRCGNGEQTATARLTVTPVPDLRFRLDQPVGTPGYEFNINGEPVVAAPGEQSLQLYRGQVRIGRRDNPVWADRVTWIVGDSMYILDRDHPEFALDLGTEDVKAVVRTTPLP